MLDQEQLDAYNYQIAQDNARTTPDDEYAATLREERVRTLLTEIDPANQVESIIMGIRGYRYDKLSDIWVKRENVAEISENFIGKVEYILSEELCLNTTFSNMQTADINKIMALLIDILVSDVVVHGRDYTVKIKENSYNLADDHNLKEIILYGIFSAVYKAMRRSINGTEARRFFGSLRMNETISPPGQRKMNPIEALKGAFG